MTMSTLMCPHCGGRLLIDPTQRLQSMLSCPYCGRKSLMQKKNGMIMLRGIISQASPPKSQADEEQALKQLDAEYRLPGETTEQPDEQQVVLEAPSQDISQEVAPWPSSDGESDRLGVEPAEATKAEADMASLFTVLPVDQNSDMTITHPSTEEPLSETPAEKHPEQTPVHQSIEESASAEPATAEPATAEPAMAEPVAAESVVVSPVAAEPATAESVLAQPLPVQSVPTQQISVPFVPVPSAPVQQPPVQTISTEQSADKERLIALAARMAASGQIPAFNSYARRAIDCDPTDPRIYAIRARLIEEAHGFARATFLSPVWLQQTPRQKAWIIAQHFSSLNAAVTYSPEAEQQALAEEAGALIAWQIRETFVENARIRLGKRPFNGRFHRTDLRTAPSIIDACLSINETVVPHVSSDLLRSIRQTLAKLDPRLADRIQKIGF